MVILILGDDIDEKKQDSSLKKNTNAHIVEAHTSHFKEEPMELAVDFFEDGFVRPLDSTSVLADNLTKKIKNDFQN